MGRIEKPGIGDPYDQMLHYESANQPEQFSPAPTYPVEFLREPDHPSQEPQALPHAPALVTPGTTGNSGALELCSVPVGTLGTRSHKTLPGQDSTGDKRVADPSGQGAIVGEFPTLENLNEASSSLLPDY